MNYKKSITCTGFGQKEKSGIFIELLNIFNELDRKKFRRENAIEETLSL